MSKPAPFSNKRLESLAKLPVAVKITGFASPATGYEAHGLSIDEMVGMGAPHIYLWKLDSEALSGLSIYPDDLLVVNRGAKPCDGAIAVIIVDEDHRICQIAGRAPNFTFWIEPVAGQREAIESTESISLWGIVERVVRDLRVFA
ncbi:peptidase S24/S26 domain-containing protein [Pseudomonas sp. CFBP 13719]|uniref:peptidase S24/S26 domain-containing protein n=1 Tax=Pseudomonas sp. CFBP 13719 TaxID=2775303 RepID=UPI0017817551|nr:peptidase S24/S26 domain-containing protein [Pseudomonas sp. CFBP 13719]MBD8614998.1 peptidase S24/S26 domain-containing protein [Pseudomonas putida]MBD8681319.1 peptidase S24/S26 domain-containing protein [Pseudomonas sp. CFBP 13719]